jgi:hypothetical protein
MIELDREFKTSASFFPFMCQLITFFYSDVSSHIDNTAIFSKVSRSHIQLSVILSISLTCNSFPCSPQSRRPQSHLSKPRYSQRKVSRVEMERAKKAGRVATFCSTNQVMDTDGGVGAVRYHINKQDQIIPRSD